MDFTDFPDIGQYEGNPELVAFLLLLSIAAEEFALANLIDAEAEKLRAIIDGGGGYLRNPVAARNFDELLEGNRSVESLLKAIIKKEMILEFKFDNILLFLDKTNTPGLG